MEGVVTTKEILPKPEFEIRKERSLEFIAQSIKDYEGVGDEEAVFMLALTLDHPEWEEEILKQIQQHKPHVHDVDKILEKLEANYSKWQPASRPTEDIRKWNEHLPEIKDRVDNLIAYFNPSADEVVKKVIIVPSDTLLPSKETGRSIHVGGTVVIMSHTENPDNFEHEFLHTIINPLTEKLAKSIPADMVIALASNKLKEEEGYGDNALSLLNEELIRTHNLIENGESVKTFADYKRFINSLDETSFNRILATDQKLKVRLKEMEIFSFKEFKRRLEEYYNKYLRNALREKIYHLYRKFDAEKAANPRIRFSEFLTREIETLLAGK